MAREFTFEEVLATFGRLDHTIRGVSMLPLLWQRRDIVTILPKPEGRLKRLDVPLFKRDNGDYVIHRIMEVKPGGYGICGDNQAFVEWVREDQIVGIVDSVQHGGCGKLHKRGRVMPLRLSNEHPTFSLSYRLYLQLWCGRHYLIIRKPIVWAFYKTFALIRKLRGRKPRNHG